MDFSKLTPEEVTECIGYVNYNECEKIFKKIWTTPTELYPCPIVDLYIATILYREGVYGIKDNLENYNIEELAKYFYLGKNIDKIRIYRINRMLLEYNNRLEIIPSVFQGTKREGDFKYMIESGKYPNSLFIFNDNQENFLLFHNYLQTGRGKNSACSPGGGNAIIRPYQCNIPPTSCGIPTGSKGIGYKNLHSAKPYIDAAFNHIKILLANGYYKYIYYSADSSDNYSLGVSIFSPSEDVKQYIVDNIWKLGIPSNS